MDIGNKEARSPILRVRNKKDLPEDAVMVSKVEATKLQWQLIVNWKPRRDVWPYTYGIGILSGVAALTSAFINSHYRRKLNLIYYAPMVSFLPVVMMPTLFTAGLHVYFVANENLLQNYTCPICMSTRAVLFQLVCGVAYPLVLAPITTFYLAGVSYRHPVPNVTDYKNLFMLYKKVNKRLGSKLVYLAALQVIAATAITKFEMMSIEKINSKLIANEEAARSREL